MEYKKNIRRREESDSPDEEPMEEVSTYRERKSHQGGGWIKLVVALVVIVVVVVVGWCILANFTNLNLPGAGSDDFSSNAWYAVFLSNGQVYFGKVSQANKNDLTLINIYYLQVVTKPLQRTQEGVPASGQTAQTQQELSLFKLGNELHGPTDEMVINRQYILLTERLKNDSKVVTAINNYLNQQKTKN